MGTIKLKPMVEECFLLEEKDPNKLLNFVIKDVIVKLQKSDPEKFSKIAPYLEDESKMLQLLNRPEVRQQAKELQSQLELKTEADDATQQEVDPVDKAAQNVAGAIKTVRDFGKKPGVKTAVDVGKGAVKTAAWSLFSIVKLLNWIRRQTGDIKFAVGLAVIFLTVQIFGPQKVAHSIGFAMEYTGKAIQAATAEKKPEEKHWYSGILPGKKEEPKQEPWYKRPFSSKK